MRPYKIVIPSRNVENLTRCIEAIRKQGEQGQIIVVDDGLSHRPGFEGVRYAPGLRPFVFARNANLGITYAQNGCATLYADGTAAYHYEPVSDVFLLNDDALLQTPFGVRLLSSIVAARPKLGILSAAVDHIGNPNQYPKGQGYRDEPSRLCFVGVYVRRELVSAIGLLDERFTGYGFDDDDYSRRAVAAGFELGVYDEVVLHHKTLPSTFRGAGFPVEGFAYNKDQFEKKYASARD